MSRSPYRALPAERAVVGGADAPDDADRDLLPVFAVLWLASLAHTVVALKRDASIGPLTVLAVLVLVGLPWLTKFRR